MTVFARSTERLANRQGLTMVEIMIASVIITIVMVGIVQLHYFCQTVADYGKNVLYAMTDAQSQMEVIRSHTYGDIAADFGSGGTPGNTFALTSLTGMGVISVDSSNTDLLAVTVAVSYQNTNGRITGNDVDFDGVQDGGEGDILDSPVRLVTYIARP